MVPSLEENAENRLELGGQYQVTDPLLRLEECLPLRRIRVTIISFIIIIIIIIMTIMRGVKTFIIISFRITTDQPQLLKEGAEAG